ncbi:putative signal peptide protein [Puccinia sorghi]|uniref:Putative signal peptide protein n=1 Tax=Puccinia sorghi TaxID=27349 RepID=A0A0L6V6Q6_9BASI|nr:putative signal peptide protein [Puccinia sorghi]
MVCCWLPVDGFACSGGGCQGSCCCCCWGGPGGRGAALNGWGADSGGSIPAIWLLNPRKFRSWETVRSSIGAGVFS